MLEQLNYKVTIACDGARLSLLQKEFPHLNFLFLPGYNITYSNNKRLLSLKILLQSPKILQKIRAEKQWLRQIIEEKKIDAVISDNRYGLFSKKVPCIFITHQLQIQAPFKWLEQLIQKINYSYINRFTECWVPDLEGNLNIAGALSHPIKLPSVRVKYLGVLSRMEYVSHTSIKNNWLILLSGPEPQRTILEKKIYSSLPFIRGKILFAKGKPGNTEAEQVVENCIIVNHLPGNEMQKAFEESEFIISRSGYTTVMELLSMQKKALLIPTPGQTEQEYLAGHLMQQGWCYTCNQDDDLVEHIKKASTFNFKLPKLAPHKLEQVIKSFVEENLSGQ